MRAIQQYDNRFLEIDQIRISKAWDPVPWTTFEKGEFQLGPAVVEPGEPGVLLSNLLLFSLLLFFFILSLVK